MGMLAHDHRFCIDATRDERRGARWCAALSVSYRELAQTLQFASWRVRPGRSGTLGATAGTGTAIVAPRDGPRDWRLGFLLFCACSLLAPKSGLRVTTIDDGRLPRPRASASALRGEVKSTCRCGSERVGEIAADDEDADDDDDDDDVDEDVVAGESGEGNCDTEAALCAS